MFFFQIQCVHVVSVNIVILNVQNYLCNLPRCTDILITMRGVVEMTNTEREKYIEDNIHYVKNLYVVDFYRLKKVSIARMYREVRFAVYEETHDVSEEELLKELGISLATYYRYKNDGVIHLNVQKMFECIVQMKRDVIVRKVEIGSGNVYEILADYMNSREYEDGGYKYSFRTHMSVTYCRNLWSKLVKDCYLVVDDDKDGDKDGEVYYGDYYITIHKAECVDGKVVLSVETYDVSNKKTKNTIWKLNEMKFLAELGRRINSFVDKYDTSETRYDYVICNYSKNKKIKWYLELLAYFDDAFMLV